MAANFVVEAGKTGARVVLTGPWSSAVADYIRREEIPELYLNYARGWKGRDVTFLAEVPNLIGFGILDWTIDDIAPVHGLSRLRYLQINTYCKTPIDFEAFPDLERCSFYWRAGSRSLFDRHSLTELAIHRFTGRKSAQVGRLANLQSLSIYQSALEEVVGLGDLLSLRFLGLYDLKRLRSLAGLERLSDLEELEINSCPNIGAIDALSPLHRLRRVQLNDDGGVHSLAPLKAANQLNEVLFYDSTNILDGDLSVLLALPLLRNVSFKERAHYSHGRQAVEEHVAGRPAV